jgi:hypothetical protein
MKSENRDGQPKLISMWYIYVKKLDKNPFTELKVFNLSSEKKYFEKSHAFTPISIDLFSIYHTSVKSQPCPETPYNF